MTDETRRTDLEHANNCVAYDSGPISCNGVQRGPLLGTPVSLLTSTSMQLTPAEQDLVRELVHLADTYGSTTVRPSDTSD